MRKIRIFTTLMLFALMVIILNACNQATAETPIQEIPIQETLIQEIHITVEEPIITTEHLLEYNLPANISPEYVTEYEPMLPAPTSPSYSTFHLSNGYTIFADDLVLTLISPQYTRIGPFSDGLAPATIASNYRTAPNLSTAFIDRTGQQVIPPKFEDAHGFNEGLAAARYGGLWGYINISGEWVIPPTFRMAGRFYNGMAIVRGEGGNEWGVIDNTGQVIVPLIHPPIRLEELHPHLISDTTMQNDYILEIVQKDGYWGFADAQGQVVIPIIYDSITPFQNGVAVVRSDGYAGLIDKTGRLIVPFGVYTDILHTNSDLLAVNVPIATAENAWEAARWGFINSTGEVVTPPRFNYIPHLRNYFEQWFHIGGLINFFDNMLIVGENGLLGFIDDTGNVVIQPQFEYVSFFGDYGLAHNSGRLIVDQDQLIPIGGIWHLIDKQGNILASFEYAHVSRMNENFLTFWEYVDYFEDDWGDVFSGLRGGGTMHFQRV